MKRRMISWLMALCMLVLAVAPTGVVVAEELYFPEIELEVGKNEETRGEDELGSLNNSNLGGIGALTQKDWAAAAKTIRLTGAWREDIVNIARTQIGYSENSNGLTIYHDEKAEEATDWTALFVNWVADQAGLTTKQFPHANEYASLRSAMDKVHALKKISRTAYPTAGDLLLIDDGSHKLVGIVEYVSNGYANVIHGDDHGKVTRSNWQLMTSSVRYYIDLNVLMERAGIEVGKGGNVPEIPEGGVAAWTNTKAVYLRSEPTTASKSLTTVKKAGTAVLVTSAALEADGYIWYGVTYNNKVGYIRGDLLNLDLSAIPTPTPAPVVTPAPTVAPVIPEVMGCVTCANVSDGVALPVDCCYEQLAAMGAEYANQFMNALAEVDPLTRALYVKCHDAHVAAGAQAIIPLGGFSVENRVVNIDVKKALVGEAVTIGFEIYGAAGYQWYEVTTDENGAQIPSAIAGATKAELTVTAQPGQAVSYYCVATMLLGYNANDEAITVAMTSKLTTITGDAPVTAIAILGEEVNFTYEYVGAIGYQWYVKVPGQDSILISDDGGNKAAFNINKLGAGMKLTIYADAETSADAGVSFYCEALDKAGNVLATSSSFAYSLDVTNLCKYVDELVNMTRSERYDIMTGLWASVDSTGKALVENSNETTLAEAIVNHWKRGEHISTEGMTNTHAQDYPSLLCTCDGGMKAPGKGHTQGKCGWYVASEVTDTEKHVYYIDAIVGLPYYHSCELSAQVNYALYYNDVLLQSGSSPTLKLMADVTDRVYKCIVTKANNDTVELTYIVSGIYDYSQYIPAIQNNFADQNTLVYDTATIYDHMVHAWNKTIVDATTQQQTNLAKEILLYWYLMEDKFEYEKKMFCTCCISGNQTDGYTVSDQIILPPNTVHTNKDCHWYRAQQGINPAYNANGELYYELMLKDANGNLVKVAESEMLDGKYHYLKDIATGWYVAYLYEEINADGTVTQWVVPLSSNRDQNQ